VLERIIELTSHLGHWAYLVVFLGAFLECAAFLGFVIPGETLVVFGGFLVSTGQLHLTTLLIVVIVGAIAGDSVGYELGHHFGRQWLLHYGRYVGLKPEHVELVDAFFARHGGKAVFLGRFTALLRAMTPFIAGASKMPYTHFLFYNAIGGAVWGTVFTLLGYFVGSSWQAAEKWVGRLGMIGLASLVLLAIVVWFWRRHGWDVLALRRGLARTLAFLRARLTPGERFGLRLTLGAAVIVGGIWGFVEMADAVLEGDPMTVVDEQVERWLAAHRTPLLTEIMFVVTFFGSGYMIFGAATVVAVTLIEQGDRRRLLELILVVPGGILLNQVLKLAIQRPRPHLDEPLLELFTYSFPSGHAMSSTLLYGLLAVFRARHLHDRRWREAVYVAAALVVLLVGFSRMYLGVHYPSDVVAGAVAGTAWLLLCVTTVDIVAYRRDRRRAAGS
jgi:undecaprenyl-diphosphatase